MTKRIALNRLRIDLADNGYLLEATYRTDKCSVEGWPGEEQASTVHTDIWGLTYDIRALLDAEAGRKEAESSALEQGVEVVEHGELGSTAGS